MSNAPTTTQDRALTLLGQGIGPEQVALALGVTTSAISQLVSDPEFAARVSELRFKNLAKHNERDNAYDALEDELLEKLKNLIPFMMRPMEVLKSIQVINAAKRRGSSAPESIMAKNEVVPLVLPQVIINQFTLNANNQVIQAGQQELVTIQSGSLNRLLEKRDVIPLPAPPETASSS